MASKSRNINVRLVLTTAVRGEAFGDVVKQLNRMKQGIEQGGDKSVYTKKKLQDMLQTLQKIKTDSSQYSKLMANPEAEKAIARLNSLYKRLRTNIEGAAMGKRGSAFQIPLTEGQINKTLNELQGYIDGAKEASKASDVLSGKIQDMFQTLEKVKTNTKQYNKLMANPKAQKAIERLNVLYKKLQTNIEAVSKGKKGSAREIPLIEGQINKTTNELQGYIGEAGKAGLASTALSGKVEALAGQGLSKLGLSFGEVAGAAGMTATAATGVGLAIVLVAGMVAFAVKRIKVAIKQVKDFKKSLMKLWNGLKNAVSGFRLLSQGLLSVARSMTFFVSAPLIAFLKEGGEAALGLESALIRVAKVTGKLFDNMDDLGKYSDRLQELAAVSISSAEELAGFSEQLGQMGVADADAMYELVAIMDVVANATDMAQDTIARDLGAISNAFGYSMADTAGIENAIAFIDRTAEVINALENEAGVTGGEVVEMLKDVGSVFAGLTTDANELGKAFEMNVAQIAGWVTIAKEMGMTADEVGTAMRNLPSYVLDNADAIDKYNISNEMFSSTQEFVNSLHKDFYNTMDALIGTLAEEDEALKAVAFSTDLLGRRSGRLIQNLIKAKKETKTLGDAFVRYDDIMAEALDAWEHGGTLMDEYTKMTESVNAQLKLLKNNFQNLGVTIGKDILPKLNGLVKIAQSATLAVSNMYKLLGDGTKKIIGKVIAFAALYGPVSWFLSQTVFGISMVINGFMRMASIVGPLIGIISKLAMGVLTLNPVLVMIAGTLYMLFSQYTGGVRNVVDTTAKVFSDLINNTGKSAKTLMETFADGIIAGGKLVIGAISAVASTIASFLEAHSPPEQGPLSSIDMWGSVLMNTYLKGFAKADFGILSDVAGKIEGILSSIHFTPAGDDDDKERKKIVKDLIHFREQFTKLLKDYRSGVKISENYIDNLVAGYGSSADEVKKLITAHLNLERVQRRLADIEKERSEIDRKYEEQVEVIRLSGASAEDMVESIASVTYERDQNLGALSEEEKLLKRREEMFAAQLDLQQDLMEALQEQSDLWKELLTLTTGGGGKQDSSIGGAGIINTTGIDEIKSKAKEAQTRFIDLWIAAEKFRVVLMTVVEYAKDLWNILLGKALPEESITERILGKFDMDTYGKELISKWQNIFGEIKTTSDLEAFFSEYGDKILTGLTEMMPAGEAKTLINNWVKELIPDEGLISEELLGGKLISPEFTIMPALSDIELPDTSYLQTFLTQFEEDVQPISDLAAGFVDSPIIEGMNTFFGAISDGFNGIPAEAGQENNKLYQIGVSIGEVAKIIFEHMPDLADAIGNLALSLMNFYTSFLGIEDNGNALAALDDILTKIEDVITAISRMFDAYANFFDYVRNPTPINMEAIKENVPEEYRGMYFRMGGNQAISHYGSAHQGGGWVSTGIPTKVGEAGAELFSPPYRGKITSHSLTTKMMHDLEGVKAGGININIDSPIIRDEQDIDQLVDILMYRIAQEI